MKRMERDRFQLIARLPQPPTQERDQTFRHQRTGRPQAVEIGLVKSEGADRGQSRRVGGPDIAIEDTDLAEDFPDYGVPETQLPAIVRHNRNANPPAGHYKEAIRRFTP